jgi:DNA-binding transcriptional LysR family regulator
MRTEQVKYFLETVKTGSFTKAAENLHIHQTSLREAIIAMENELGKTLFIRSKKGVELTEAGKYSLPHFQLIAESYDRLCQGYTNDTQMKTVTIDAQSIFGDYLISFFTILKPQFASEGIMLDINIDNHVEAIMNRLIRQQTSLAFIGKYKGEENTKLYDVLQKNQLEVSNISTFEVAVMMQKEHPLAQKKKLSINDFAEYGFVFCNDSAPMKAIIKSKNIFKHTKMLVLDNRVLMEKYLKSSNMVAFVPQGSSVDEGFVLRSVVECPQLEQVAVYRKGEMTPELLRCINMMKMIIDSTAL